MVCGRGQRQNGLRDERRRGDPQSASPGARIRPERGGTHESLINAAFADAHGIGPGVDMRIVLNGRLETFLVTGIALSAEYVYAVKSGLPIADDRYFAVLWIDRAAAEGSSRWKVPSTMRS
jgi:hypothetical protein